jgi:di/tricarboxylate transporter
MDSASFLSLTWQGWFALATVAATFGIFMCTNLPSDCVFLGGLSALLLAGVIDIKEALAGFSSSGVITVGVLYTVVAGLRETGGLIWIAQHVLGHPRTCRGAQFRLMAPVTMLSAFLNNTPVVALFIPVVMEWSRRIRVPASRLLIPLSYASIFGGICTLIGTSTNLVVHGLVQERYHNEGLHMFEITKIGIPCAVVGILFVALFRKLLPDRQTFGDGVRNPREYTLEMEVLPGGPLTGKTIQGGGLRHLPGAFVAELIRGQEILSAVPPEEILQAGDRLVFVGNVDSMRTLYHQGGLRPAPDQLFKLDTPRHKRCLVEAVVSNTCPLVGQSIREGRFRDRYNAVVIAVARNGERLGGRIGDIVLCPGDTLLIESHAGFITRQRDSRDFYLVSAMEDTTPKRLDKAPWAFAILVGMVAAAAFGWLPMLKAALLAAGLMLITGCCSFGQARQNIEWHVLLTIAAALALGGALEKTGAAKALAGSLLSLTAERAWLTLAVVYLTTTFFTEIITNNAAAALVFPVAMNVAEGLSVNKMPFIICIMIAASASFATPIGYQTNLMVYGPGGYRFTDYLRIGLLLNFLIGIVTVILCPLIWPFSL